MALKGTPPILRVAMQVPPVRIRGKPEERAPTAYLKGSWPWLKCAPPMNPMGVSSVCSGLGAP